jgi:hypothetical protein
MLIHTLHAAIDDREHTFNGVRVDVTAHVFIGTVADGSCAAGSAGGTEARIVRGSEGAEGSDIVPPPLIRLRNLWMRWDLHSCQR